MRGLVRAIVFPAAACALLLLAVPARAVPRVWSGFNFEFTRPNGVEFADPRYRDVITSQTAIVRGDTRGIFNIVSESANVDTSPANTLWATNLVPGNAGQVIAATNWAQLSFTAWQAAYGGSSSLGTAILTRTAVVHLVAEDVYLDLRFTDWTQRGGGGFAYERAVDPNLFATDFNRDGVVSGADLAVWSANYGALNATGPMGDADGDQDVDGHDFLAWQRTLGSGPPAQAVPEGPPVAGLAACLAWFAARRRSS